MSVAFRQHDSARYTIVDWGPTLHGRAVLAPTGRVRAWARRAMRRNKGWRGLLSSPIASRVWSVGRFVLWAPDHSPYAGMVIPPEAASLWAVRIEEPYRGRGFAKHMLREMVEVARERGYQYIWLQVYESNRPAIRAYRHLGFRKIPKRLRVPQGTSYRYVPMLMKVGVL